MELKELFQIWDRFERSSATEIEFEKDELRFRLKKDTEVKLIRQEAKDSGISAITERKEETAAAALPNNADTVKAPFVGTFYSAPAPGEAPYVKLGQRVKKGDVIGIIEAMKLMNEIIAPKDGVINDIFVEDETLVEYDQPLMSIGE